MLPDGSPFQDVVLTAKLHINPETSLDRLVPLVEIWQHGNFCQYISLGPADYRKRVSIQFGSRPAQVYEGFFHRGSPPADSGNGTRSESSVRERGNRICTSLQQGNWVLQPVFHSSKEGWGLRSILDLRNLNDCVMQLKLKMLTLRKIVPQIRFEDWFVTIDLKDAYFQISITPHFHEMHRCSPGASSALGYSYYELHRRLVDSSSVASVGSAASRCRAGPHERVGITAKRQKECAFSTTEDHFPWHGMGLNVDSGAPVTGT